MRMLASAMFGMISIASALIAYLAAPGEFRMMFAIMAVGAGIGTLILADWTGDDIG